MTLIFWMQRVQDNILVLLLLDIGATKHYVSDHIDVAYMNDVGLCFTNQPSSDWR